MNKLFTELRRRNIFRVAGVYALIGWLLMQIVSVMTPALALPGWVDSFFAILLLVGFPLAILLTWAFEMTPEGVKRTEAVDEGQSVTAKTGRTLDYVIIAGLVLVGAMIIWQGTRSSPTPFEAAKNAAPQDEVNGKTNSQLHPRIQSGAGSEGSSQAIVSKDASADASNTPPPASIAVLPFADLSPGGDQEYFSDGMAEEILNVLAHVDGLKVASRTSSFQFKGQEAIGIPRIAGALNVRYVLEGSVRKSGDAIRITGQLIDALTDTHVWSQTYDRTLTAENIFAIQDEIANEIVTQLGIVMDDSSPGVPAVSVKADTKNLNAYELFLRAHNKFLTRKDLPGTIALYERAVAADPKFARAWAGLAAVYTVAPSWGVLDRDYNTLSEKSANKAIALNSGLALPYAVLGNLESDKFPVDFTKTFAFFDQAILRDPKETTTWLWRGINNNTLGYFDKAEQDFAQCLALDPAYENCRGHMSFSKLYMGDTKGSLEIYEQSLMNGASTAVGVLVLPTYAAMGDLSAVRNMIPYITASLGIGDDGDVRKLAYRALTQPDFNIEKERGAIESAYERVTGKPLDWASPQNQRLALFYRNFAAVKNPGIGVQAWWRPYPAALKASPHRKRWMVEVGLPTYWRKNGFPPQCKPVGKDDFECD